MSDRTKELIIKTLLVIVCLVSMVLYSGCSLTSSTNDFTGDYYKKEDFQSITIGESTYQDVHKIAPAESIQITSYGGFCQYPMQNGGYVLIKFYGKHLIVGAVEELSGEVDLH